MKQVCHSKCHASESWHPDRLLRRRQSSFPRAAGLDPSFRWDDKTSSLRPSRSFAGFTLIEILIAATLMSFIGLISFSSLFSALNAKDRVEKNSQQLHLLRQAVARMSREISMAYESMHSDPAQARRAEFIGAEKEIRFRAFAQFVEQKDAKTSDQVRIRYFIESENDGTRSLMRTAEVPPLQEKSEQAEKTQLLCPNVSSIKFEYYNELMNAWDPEWSTEGAARKNELPKRVRVTLAAVVPPNTKEQNFVGEAEIILSKPFGVQ
jgi:general secretion pathway protein J